MGTILVAYWDGIVHIILFPPEQALLRSQRGVFGNTCQQAALFTVFVIMGLNLGCVAVLQLTSRSNSLGYR
jgi:hypothetical protein